jgi:hypothetical protein
VANKPTDLDRPLRSVGLILSYVMLCIFFVRGVIGPESLVVVVVFITPGRTDLIGPTVPRLNENASHYSIFVSANLDHP